MDTLDKPVMEPFRQEIVVQWLGYMLQISQFLIVS